MTGRFNTLVHGTAERFWQERLAGLPAWEPRRGPLIVVAPHPDDETLGAGGLIYACARRNCPVLIMSLTDGERSRDDTPELGRVRIHELYRAKRFLAGDRVRILRLGLPDGALSAHEDEIVCALDDLVGRHTTLIVPFSADGHPDHEAAARAAQRVADKHSIPVLQYPIWAWHHSQPDELDLSRACRFDLSARAQRAKSLAVACFKSQTEDKIVGPTVPKHVLKYFVRPFEVFVS
jgi:LmbE family N-acetylglucosaminyl deacetylase